MNVFNKKVYIDKMVLNAKIGKKADYERLREMYSFLLEQIYQGVSEVYPFLKTRKMDIFHDFYFYFWDAINSYKFDSDYSFSLHLKNSLIESARNSISYQYGFETVKSASEIKIGICKKRPKKHRKIIYRALKSLTVKQKKVVYLHCYRHNTYLKCRDITNWGRTTIEKALFRSFRRMRVNLSKVKSGKKRIKHKEKVHKICQIKLENV